jgi:hypothetical protein
MGTTKYTTGIVQNIYTTVIQTLLHTFRESSIWLHKNVSFKHYTFVKIIKHINISVIRVHYVNIELA